MQRKVQWSFRFLFPCEILLQSARNASKNRGSNETESKYFGLENLWSSPGCRKSFVNADYEVSSSAFHCSFRKLNPANGLLVTHCTFFSHSGEEHLFLKFNLKALLYVMPSYLATCLKVCDWDVHQTPYIWLHGACSDRSEIWLIWHLNFILMKYLTCRIFYPTLMYVRLSLPNVLFSTSWVWSCFILRISYARRSLSCTFHLFWIISKWNQWLEVQEDVAVVQSSI